MQSFDAARSSAVLCPFHDVRVKLWMLCAFGHACQRQDYYHGNDDANRRSDDRPPEPSDKPADGATNGCRPNKDQDQDQDIKCCEPLWLLLVTVFMLLPLPWETERT